MDAKAIIFLRKTHTKSNGKNTVYLRFYIGRKYKQISLKIDVLSNNWNDKTKRVKKNAPNAIQKNNIIRKAEIKAEQIILEARQYETDITFEDFKRLFTDNNKKITMSELAEMHVKSLVNPASGTKRKYNAEISKLHDFKPNLTLHACNTTKFINDYLVYLTDRGNNANTKNKSFTVLRTLVNLAQRKGYAKNNIFTKNPVKVQPSKKEFLTPEELNQLEKLLNDKNALKVSEIRILEYFLFACYTGLRWGDIRTLKYKHIKHIEISNKGQKQTIPFVIKIAEKTKNTSGAENRIPLITKAQKMIGTGLPEQNVFNTVTGQVANRYIKDIIKKADIDKNISFHCARHTFASYLNNNKAEIYAIKELLAHSNVKVTQNYIKTLDYSLVDAMDKWND